MRYSSFKSSHEFSSILLRSQWLHLDSLSIVVQRRWLEDHRDWVLQVVLVLKVKWYVSVVLVTNYLGIVNQFMCTLGGMRQTLQYVQADASKFIDIRMIDLCQESNLGRCHRVVFW